MDKQRTPAVSVCIPLYMKERYVGETVRSVLGQTFGDFELVVLHNASPDRSAEVVATFDDPRVRLLHNDVTVPGPENFARVVAASRAPLVKVVSADDRLHPTMLERQVAVMADPTIAMTSCRQDMIGEDGEVVYRNRSLRRPELIGRRDRTTVLRRVVRHVGNPIGTFVNVIFRRSAYEAAGGMPGAPFIALDMALWMAVLEHGDFYGMDETLCDFRIASGSASADDRHGIDDQVRFTGTLRRANADALRRSDLVYGTLRTPVLRARHGTILAAAGPSSSLRARLARAVLARSREEPGAR